MYNLKEVTTDKKIIREHWKNIIVGKNIRTVLACSIGPGNITLPISEFVEKLYGSDNDQKMIIKCKKKVQKNNIKNVELEKCDFRRLKEKYTQEIDCITITGNAISLMDLNEVRKALSDMKYIIKDKGYLYIDLWNKDKIVKEYLEDKECCLQEDPKRFNTPKVEDSFNSFSIDILKKILTELNYKEIEIKPFPNIKKNSIEKCFWYCVLAKNER